MKKILLALCACLLAMPLFAANNLVAANDVSVETLDVQLVGKDAANAEVFMELENRGTRPYALVAANSPVAVQTQLHETLRKNNTSEMEQVKSILIEPHSDRVLKVGGFHVMLMGLRQPLKPGDNIPLTLIFADGSSLQITAPVN